EVELHVERHGARQIALEHARALEHPDEQRPMLPVIAGQLQTHFPHALSDLVGGEQDPDGGVGLNGGLALGHRVSMSWWMLERRKRSAPGSRHATHPPGNATV